MAKGDVRRVHPNKLRQEAQNVRHQAQFFSGVEKANMTRYANRLDKLASKPKASPNPSRGGARQAAKSDRPKIHPTVAKVAKEWGEDPVAVQRSFDSVNAAKAKTQAKVSADLKRYFEPLKPTRKNIENTILNDRAPKAGRGKPDDGGEARSKAFNKRIEKSTRKEMNRMRRRSRGGPGDQPRAPKGTSDGGQWIKA